MKIFYAFFKFITPIFLLIILGVVIWFLLKWYSDPQFKISGKAIGEILKVDSHSKVVDKQNSDLRIISYNMGFAAGPMQHSLADEHPKEFFMNNLNKTIAMISQQDADIVLLQEVDINSKRSWYFNQLYYMMEKLEFSYAAPVLDWDLYFPLRKEKKITKATVVLSKFPIVSNRYNLTVSKPNFEDKLLNIFYYPLLWNSCMQRVEIDLGDRMLDVYNVHLCVWSRDARVAQAESLVKWINKESSDRDYVIGGDFNFQAYIRGTPKPVEDMAKQPFMDILWRGLSGVGEILSKQNDSISEIHKNVTFKERGHRYDFLFYSKGLKLEKAQVIDSIDSSDHLPVAGVFVY